MLKMERRRSKRKMGMQYSLIGILLSATLAFAMHHTVFEQGRATILESVQSEAGLVVEMTKGFVRAYSVFGARYTNGQLPNPAIFRADALRHVKKDSQGKTLLTTGVVGLPGKEIAQVAKDDAMRRQLLAFAASPSTKVISSVFEQSGQTTHRSLWAFTASEQACADCHNQIQKLNGSDQWQLGDLMGAQVVEQNIDPQLANVRRTAIVQAVLLFAAVLASWFWFIYLLNHFRLSKELKTLAATDPLTGCINRRELHDRVSRLKGRANGALLMMDLDKFKLINDTYGHEVGDKVICDFTSRLKSSSRMDDWVARFGGEEFVVWLPNTKPVDAIRIAERLRESTEQVRIAVGDKTIQYTVSIGVHIVKNAMPNRFEAWIKIADQLVYRAKKEGRNRIVCQVSTTD